MKIEDHYRNIRESIEVIDDCIRNGVVSRQRNIGFNVSAASVEMLEVFLHKEKLINPGTILKHEWFLSLNRINEKLPFDFPEKEKIMGLIHEIEEKRNFLCYGKLQPQETLLSFIENFNQLKNIFAKLGVEVK